MFFDFLRRLWIFEFQSQSGRTASTSRPQPHSQHEYCTVGCSRLSWLTRECAISSWCYVRSVKLVWFDLVLLWFDFGGIEKLKWVWLELVRFRVESKHRQFYLKMNRAITYFHIEYFEYFSLMYFILIKISLLMVSNCFKNKGFNSIDEEKLSDFKCTCSGQLISSRSCIVDVKWHMFSPYNIMWKGKLLKVTVIMWNY